MNEHDGQNQDVLAGRNPVMEALNAGRPINRILVADGFKEGSIKQIIAIAKEKGIVVQNVDRRKLDSVSGIVSHQGIIAITSPKEYAQVDDMLDIAASKGHQPFIIILDGIEDIYNFGSILRTAEASGADGVIIPKRRAAGLSSAVAKASAGAIEHIAVAQVVNLAREIDELKKKGFWVAGADSEGGQTIYETDLKGPIALVIGGEGKGLSRLVREKCDYIINIPMYGKMSSLSAPAAAAIAMYEIMRQRATAAGSAHA